MAGNTDTPILGRARAQRRVVAAAAGAALCAALWLGTSTLGPFGARAGAAANDPNIVLLLTDDQTLEEMRALPYTSALIAGGGVTFKQAYISFPLCCPARASLLSGQYMHNNGVRGNGGQFGGWARFSSLGKEARSLPTWLQGAGYYNVHVGKYMNGYNGGEPPIPPGWNEWYGKVSEYDDSVFGSRIYFNYQMREDPPDTGGVPCPSAKPPAPGRPFTCFYGGGETHYQTDVIRNKAVEAIGRISKTQSDRPFFISVGFNAPHSPYIPAPRHAGAYAGVGVPKPKGQNEKNLKDKPRFLRRLPRLGKGKLRTIVQRSRNRLAMLRSVDEAVASIATALLRANELKNTYLIFASDNGYFSGEHRIRQGKYLPHEPSSHVPLMIRGPGIPAGGVSHELVSNVDLAATIAQIAGAQPRLPQDGRSLLPFARFPGLESTRPILLEGDTGPSIDDEGREGPMLDARRLKRFHKKLRRKKRQLKRKCRTLRRRSKNKKLGALCFRRGVRNLEQEPTDKFYKLRAPAFQALRTDRYALFAYATGELELYDMWRDPHQLNSVHKNRRYRGVRKWLLPRLGELAGCAGARCSWEIGPDPVPKKKKRKKKRRALRRR